MNDRQLGLSGKDKMVISAQKEQKKEIKHLGSIIPNSGHTVFELKMQTGEIFFAEFMKESAVDFVEARNGNIVRNKKVMVKPGHIYVSALNKKNAAKHFLRMLHPIKGKYDSKEEKLIYE